MLRSSAKWFYSPVTFRVPGLTYLEIKTPISHCDDSPVDADSELIARLLSEENRLAIVRLAHAPISSRSRPPPRSNSTPRHGTYRLEAAFAGRGLALA